MDGLTDFKISPWVRRLVTRIINIIPISIALIIGLEPLDILIYSQVILSLLIALPLIPIILYTSDRNIMGNLVNKKITTILAWIFAIVITGFNVYLLYSVFF
jgi:manganese transport protein